MRLAARVPLPDRLLSHAQRGAWPVLFWRVSHGCSWRLVMDSVTNTKPMLQTGNAMVISLGQVVHTLLHRPHCMIPTRMVGYLRI